MPDRPPGRLILVVCTGNICRSPMAEALLARHLAERRLDIAVGSAGTLGWNSGPALPEVVEALAERSVGIDGHVSRRIDAPLARSAGLVLTMTNDHAEAVRLHAPDVAGRVFVLGEFARLAEQEGPRRGRALIDWVDRVDAHRPPTRRAALADEIVDPLGEPVEVYRALAARLDDLTRRIADLL